MVFRGKKKKEEEKNRGSLSERVWKSVRTNYSIYENLVQTHTHTNKTPNKQTNKQTI